MNTNDTSSQELERKRFCVYQDDEREIWMDHRSFLVKVTTVLPHTPAQEASDLINRMPETYRTMATALWENYIKCKYVHQNGRGLYALDPANKQWIYIKNEEAFTHIFKQLTSFED